MFHLNHDKNHLYQIKSYIKKELDELHEFLEERKYTFQRIEEDIHEFRRKIRWFSIYAWAFCGKIELKDRKIFSSVQRKEWIRPEVLSNPFVHLPKSKTGYKLYYNKEIFLALSVMINQVGEWKDEGLLYEHIDMLVHKKMNRGTHQNLMLRKANEMLKKYLLHKQFLKNLMYI